MKGNIAKLDKVCEIEESIEMLGSFWGRIYLKLDLVGVVVQEEVRTRTVQKIFRFRYNQNRNLTYVNKLC